jgi:hypothetical protein
MENVLLRESKDSERHNSGNSREELEKQGKEIIMKLVKEMYPAGPDFQDLTDHATSSLIERMQEKEEETKQHDPSP